MRHRRRRRRLGLVGQRRVALLRSLARSIIMRQQIVTTHARAKETSRFVDQLVTLAKKNSLHARRHIIRELGSGSEDHAKRMIETIAPKFSDRKGGYTRVLHYKTRVGDQAQMSLLEFTVPIVEESVKKVRKKKEPKAQKENAAGEVKKAEPKKEEVKKETQKKGGFLGTLRRFLKGDDDK